MKIITQTFILLIAVSVFPLVIFGQTKSITRENYLSALKEAETKTEKEIRKEVSIQKLYANGEITRTLTNTTEHLPPDRSRWLGITAEGNSVGRIEQILVGNFYYRKENEGEWVKRAVVDDEGIGLGGGFGGTDDSTREYFIEEAKIGKEKFQVLIEKTVNFNKTYFDERRIWISKKGLIFKEAATTSFMELKNIVSSIDVVYDYKVKPAKIEPPVK